MRAAEDDGVNPKDPWTMIAGRRQTCAGPWTGTTQQTYHIINDERMHPDSDVTIHLLCMLSFFRRMPRRTAWPQYKMLLGSHRELQRKNSGTTEKRTAWSGSGQRKDILATA